MVEDNKGELCFSKNKVVAKIDCIKMTFLTVKDGYKDDYIYNLMCDKSETHWVETKGMGHYSYYDKTFTNFYT